MKILMTIPNRNFFSDYDGVGGHITHFLGVLEGFGKNNVDVSVLCGDDFKKYNFVEKRFISRCFYVKSNADRLYHAYIFLHIVKSRKSYERIYVRYSASFILYKILLLLLLGRGKLIFEVNSFGSQYKSWFRLFDFSFLSLAKYVTVVSQELENFIKGFPFMSEKPVLTLENGVSDYRILKNIVEPTPQSNTLLYVGVLKDKYGIEELLDSFISSQLPHEGYIFWIVGSGPAYNKIRRRYTNNKTIIFWGAKSIEEIKGMIVNSNPYLVYPSIGEFTFQSPIKIYEYMGFGRPIIAQNTKNVSKILRDGQFGNIADLNDPDELYNVVKSVKNNFSDAVAKCRQAHHEVRARHLWEKKFKHFIDLLDEINEK